MRKRLPAVFRAICIIFCLAACGGSGPASNGGSGTGGKTGSGTGQAQDTGLFSVEGGWKDSSGNVILFDSGGKGCALAKVTVPNGSGDLDKNSLNIPDMVKTPLTWEEGAESATVKIQENEFIYQKTNDGGKEQLTVNGYVFTRLSESEQKEYEDKAASLQEFTGPVSASSGQPAGSASETGPAGGPKSKDFSDVILFDNDLVTIELVKFSEDEVNWGDVNNTLMEKYITVKVKNKSD